MALISDCYQLIGCTYRCNHLKIIKSRHSREHHHHQITRYRFEQEILVVEQEGSIQESQGKQRLLKYNNRRCNCKIKKKSSHTYNKNVSIDSKCNKSSLKTVFRDKSTSSEICASMIAGVWHKSNASQATVATLDKSKFPRQWSHIRPSFVTAFWSPPKGMSTTVSTTSHLPIICDSFDWDEAEIKSKLCDIPKNYLKKNMNSKINLLTYKKKESPVHHNHHRNFESRSNYYYLLIMFVMVIKDIIRYVSDSLNRIRRKTQVLLPILILLQLIMAAPLTNCTSPPNQTVTGNESPTTAFISPAISVSDTINSSKETRLSSELTNASASITTGADEVAKPRNQQRVISSTTTQRPSGGSSITSYINQQTKVKRDPSLSFANSGCHSCQMREQVKADNLESIKRHILLRLEMRSLPNITAPPVPHTIIENFYKNHSYFESKKSLSDVDHDEIHNDAGKSSLEYTTLSFLQSNGYVSSNTRNKINDNMQGDDPKIYSDEYLQAGEDSEEKGEQLYKKNFEDEFFSVVNSVYVFPTMPRMRHNRKAEILNFKIKGNEYSTVSQALLHVYIRGRDWIRENEPNVLDKKNFGDDRREIIITINRVVRRVNSTIATHTVNVTEAQHKIPNGLGEWISIDVTQLVQSWLRDASTNQGIVIKGSEGWMKTFITTGDAPNNKAFTVYIEMLTKDNRKRRTKRNTSMNCSESDNEERCCRYPLVVNFVEFEWTWVVAPTKFNAYFCNGECKLGFLEKYPHTHLMQLSTAPQPCCSPTKMSPLRLLYFNAENNLVMSTIPNMAVEKCSCS